jgi:hypothetical protein
VKLAALGIALVGGWFAGLLVLVNYYSETSRSGADVVLTAAWVLLLLGVVALLVAGLRSVRRPQRHS